MAARDAIVARIIGALVMLREAGSPCSGISARIRKDDIRAVISSVFTDRFGAPSVPDSEKIPMLRERIYDATGCAMHPSDVSILEDEIQGIIAAHSQDIAVVIATSHSVAPLEFHLLYAARMVALARKPGSRACVLARDVLTAARIMFSNCSFEMRHTEEGRLTRQKMGEHFARMEPMLGKVRVRKDVFDAWNTVVSQIAAAQ